jgi:polysaccharide biosynthesis/export protein
MTKPTLAHRTELIESTLALTVLLLTCVGGFAQSDAAKSASAPAAATIEKQADDRHGEGSRAAHSDSSYVIGADDVLAINVWKEPEVSRSVPVRSDGKISLPLVGELTAGGLTPLQLEQ